MTSTVDLLLPTGIKDIKHLHIMLMTIDYALKSFDDERCQSIARIITNMELQ